MTTKTNWYLVTIDDPDFLGGEIFIRMINLIRKTKEFKYVILDYIEGSGTYGLIQELSEMQDEPIDLNTVLEKIAGVNQFEWGDFFLFTDFPKNWNNPEGELYPYVMTQSNTTLRAVDGQYIYLYTPYSEIVDLVSQNYVIESVKYGDLDKLDYPE